MTRQQTGVFRRKENALAAIFGRSQVVIGVVHSKPLPGSPAYAGEPLADVHVKYGAHAIVADRSLAELTRDVEFFDADVVIATGQRTGDSAEVDEVKAIRASTGLPTVIGSGVHEENVETFLQLVDGVIVASSLKEEGVWWTPVSEEKVRRFVARADKVRPGR